MLSISRIFKTFSKPYQQCSQRKLALLALEDRVVPAVTAFYNLSSNLLTINLQSSNDTATIVYDSLNGYEINLGAVTILGNYVANSQVDRLVIQDTGDSAFSQSAKLTGDPVTLINGLSTTGVESVTISSEVSGVATNGISFKGASTKIQLEADLTTGDQPISFGGPVLLANNVTLISKDSTGGTITFSGTVNSVTASQSLSIDSGSEAVSFAGSLGATKSLNEVKISANAVSLAGNITAAGNITVDAPLALARPVTISSTGSAILFKGTINSDSASTPRSLTIGLSGQSGTTEFQDKLGDVNPLGAFTVNRSGATKIADNISTANAAVSFKGAVTLTGNSSIITKTGSNFGGSISFQSTVNGAQDLTVDAGNNGAVSFASTVGATTNLHEIQVTAKTIAIGGSITSNNNNITLTGGVILNSSPTISSKGGDITLNGSVNGSAIGNRSLTISAGIAGSAGAGDVSVDADVGNLRALSSFSISHCNDAAISKTVKASTFAVTSDDDNTDLPSITIGTNASITATTSLTMSKPNGVIDVSGRFYGAVTVTGESTTKNDSPDKTTLRAESNSNFSVTGTNVADRSKGTLVKTQPGKSAIITFSNINALDFTGGASGNAFTLNEWFYPANIDGAGGNGSSDILTVNRAQDATSGLEFILDNNNLKIDAPAGSFASGQSSPNSIDYALTSIEAASLAGGAGNDSFDISGWSAKASVIGNSGLDELIWSGSAESLLTPTSFSAGSLSASLSSIESANLENTGVNSKFAVAGFVGSVTITGATSSTVTATYNSNFALVGTGATDGTITTGSTTIDFTAGNVSLIGGNRDNTFTLDGTYVGSVNLDGGAGNDTYNVLLPANGNQVVTINDSGKTSRDAIVATKGGSTAPALAKTIPNVQAAPFVGYIYYTGAQTPATSTPRIDFSGIEIVTLL